MQFFFRDTCDEINVNWNKNDYDQYRTVTQFSYQIPYPRMQSNVSMGRDVPYFENRFLKEQHGMIFQDDCYIEHTKKLQNYRKSKHISFNPCTGEFTDGNNGDFKNMQCVKF